MSGVDSTLVQAPVRLGTRRSKLALWQANHIKASLRAHWGDRLQVELVEIVTKGDQILDRPLNEVGGKGLFVNGIEEQLAADEVDLAVHSMKDLPSGLADGMVITCTPERADPRDALVSKLGLSLEELPAGTRMGTSSLRRGALASRINEGLEIVPIRGNVPTRLKKVDDGEVDAVLLAAAGLDRLQLSGRITEHLEVGRFCPAACQGILALECRGEDHRIQKLCAPLNHARTGLAAAAERAFLARLEGGCQVPMGAHASMTDGATISIEGIVTDPSGRPFLFAKRVGPTGESARLGREVAETLLSLGADRIIANLAHSAA